jgi:hypothetical protein
MGKSLVCSKTTSDRSQFKQCATPTAPVPAPANDVDVYPAVPTIPLPSYRVLPPPQRGITITTIPVLLLALAVAATALLLSHP